MFRIRNLAFAGSVVALSAFFVQAQDGDLKAVVKKAIEAHGGAKILERNKAAVTKFKGTIELMGASRGITGETSYQKPDKFKHVMTLDINGKGIDIITVYNGSKLWVNVMGNTTEVTDEKLLSSVKEEIQTEGAGSLVDYLKEPYELNSLGAVKVKDKDAIGIRVTKKGQRDINLFFDKKTHLIIKTEMRSYDANAGQEVNQEKFLSGYYDKDGAKVPKRVEIVKDGKAFMEIEITDVQAHEKLDAAIFSKP